MNQVQKSKFRWLLFIVILWMFIGVLTSVYEYFFLDNYPGVLEEPSMREYNLMANVIAAAIWGLLGALIFGLLELFVISRFLERRPFYFIVSAKILIYTVLLFLLNLVISYTFNVIFSDRSWQDPAVLTDVLDFLNGASFWQPMLPFVGLVVLTLFLLQVDQRFGRGDLVRLIRGKYFRPQEEERFFMFLDIKGSTTIAEDLGHQQFFSLLNDFFYDITDAILYSGGEIYQYVGDEVIISWKLEIGIKQNNCLKCFFRIREVIEENAGYYQLKYGLVPEFKAGLHYGSVTIGEIGRVKKSVTFSGDVLNTTSRIQNLCNHYQVSFIVSQDALDLLDTGFYSLKEIGAVELRGRLQPVRVASVKD